LKVASEVYDYNRTIYPTHWRLPNISNQLWMQGVTWKFNTI
jgi:hypothetical protein